MCKDTKLIGKKAHYRPKSLQSWLTLFVIELVILIFGIEAGAGFVDFGRMIGVCIWVTRKDMQMFGVSK